MHTKLLGDAAAGPLVEQLGFSLACHGGLGLFAALFPSFSAFCLYLCGFRAWGLATNRKCLSSCIRDNWGGPLYYITHYVYRLNVFIEQSKTACFYCLTLSPRRGKNAEEMSQCLWIRLCGKAEISLMWETYIIYIYSAKVKHPLFDRHRSRQSKQERIESWQSSVLGPQVLTQRSLLSQ